MWNIRHLKSHFLNPFVYIYDIHTEKKVYLGYLDDCSEEIEEGVVKATLSRQAGKMVILEIGVEMPDD